MVELAGKPQSLDEDPTSDLRPVDMHAASELVDGQHQQKLESFVDVL
jgi:hypothetical protein